MEKTEDFETHLIGVSIDYMLFLDKPFNIVVDKNFPRWDGLSTAFRLHSHAKEAIIHTRSPAVKKVEYEQDSLTVHVRRVNAPPAVIVIPHRYIISVHMSSGDDDGTVCYRRTKSVAPNAVFRKMV